MNTLRLAAAASVSLLAFADAAHADEGMWTFDNFPAAKVKAAYGVTIDKAWLDHLQGAAARLSSGCSASVVTGEGLVLTNNHCVADCAQSLSGPGRDYFKDGYRSVARTEEKTCSGMQAEILVQITDITDKVLGAGKGLAGAALVRARTAVTSGAEKDACGADAKLRCEVVDLYHGGQFRLYKYRKYSDVRLVFSPGVPAAFFGGDPDNFNFPRYDLDCAFVRLYEDGRPVLTPDHLTWNASAPRDGEPVFVVGNPGGTDRQLTAAQLDFQRTLALPVVVASTPSCAGGCCASARRAPSASASPATCCSAWRTATRSIGAGCRRWTMRCSWRPSAGTRRTSRPGRPRPTSARASAIRGPRSRRRRPPPRTSTSTTA